MEIDKFVKHFLSLKRLLFLGTDIFSTRQKPRKNKHAKLADAGRWLLELLEICNLIIGIGSKTRYREQGTFLLQTFVMEKEQ